MKKSQNTSWNTITKLNEHMAGPLTLAFMERRYAQDMVSRLFFVSFYTHGRYQTFQKEGDFWSILSSMYNFTVIDNLISDVFNLSYPQKQKILSPLYNFENILLQFSEVIKVNTSMFWKTKGN